MSFKLYDYVLSGNCYKVRLMASLLKVDYEVHTVDFHPGMEHKSEELLAVNPAGTLPILEAEDLVLTDSAAMLVWMAAQFDPTGQWVPRANPNALAEVTQWLGFSSELTASVGQLRLHAMLNREIDSVSVTLKSKEVMKRLESHLCEQAICGEAWLVGEHPTVADIACFAYAALSPDAGIEHDAYPAIRNWLYELRSLNGFITMPGIHELHELRSESSKDT